MTPGSRNCLIDGILTRLQMETRRFNEIACHHGRFDEQRPFHADEVLLDLLLLSDDDLRQVAIAAGL